MFDYRLNSTVLRREMMNEPLVPHIGGPYQTARRDAPPSVPIVDLAEWPPSTNSAQMVHSINARQHLRRGRAQLAAGNDETAVLAFKAALYEVLKSSDPGDAAIRQAAAQELLQIMRREAP